MIGGGEALIIGGVLVLIFGASQIPKIARSLGEGLKEMKRAMKDVKEMDGEESESADAKRDISKDER